MTPEQSFISVSWFAARLERVIQLDDMPLAPLVNEALRKTDTDRKKAAAARKKFYEDVSWLARRSRVTHSFMDGEPLAVLVRVAPRKNSSEDVDGRVKCALDSFNKNHACVWKDDRQVAALMVERLPSQPGHGRIHMVVGVIPAWPAYEVEKQAWIRNNPAATQAEYEAAMRSITEKLGV